MEKEKRKTSSILIALFTLVSILISFAPAAHALKKEAVTPVGQFGGDFYTVKVYDSDTLGQTYYLAANESGFYVFDATGDGGQPERLKFYPTHSTIYDGGAEGVNIEHFTPGIDAATVTCTWDDTANETKNLAFYADGANIITFNLEDANIPVVGTHAVENVRELLFSRLNGTNYLFATAFRTRCTSLYIFSVSTSDNTVTLTEETCISLDDDTDLTVSNNEGGEGLKLVTDFDNDASADDPVLFVADGASGIKAVDLSGLFATTATMPTYSSNVTACETYGTAMGIDVVRFNDSLYAFVADGDEGLKVYDVTTATTSMPSTTKGSLAFTYNTGYSGWAYDIKCFGTTAFIANGKNGVQVVDISDPNTPIDITYGETTAGAQMAYIDSVDSGHDVSNDRLKGTAYSIDFDFFNWHDHTECVHQVVAWGGAGLIQTKIGLNIIQDGTDDNKGQIMDWLYDGTYIWVVDVEGMLTRLDPDNIGTNVSGTNNNVTYATPLFAAAQDASVDYLSGHLTGTTRPWFPNIVSLGGYIYGVANDNTACVRRVTKSDFSATNATTLDYPNIRTATSRDGSDDDFIYRLYADSNSVFFQIEDFSYDSGRIGRIDSATSITYTNNRVFHDLTDDVTTDLIICNGYIYGVSDTTLDHITQLPTNFSSSIDETDDKYGCSSNDIHAFAKDGSTLFCLDEDGFVCQIKTSGSFDEATSDVICSLASAPIFDATITATSGRPPLYIQDGYIYGRDYVNKQKVSRVKISTFNQNTDYADETGDYSQRVQNVLYITGDGQDLYVMADSSGDLTKIAVDRFGDSSADPTDGDNITSTSSYNLLETDFYGSTNMYEATLDVQLIPIGGYIFGIRPDGSDDQYRGALYCDRLVKIGFKAQEDENMIAQVPAYENDVTSCYSGMVRDVALAIGKDTGVDYAYVAAGEKGIIRFTVTDPDEDLSWDPSFLHAVPIPGDVPATADGDVSDDEDIRDARGIDVTQGGSVSHKNGMVLVADGAYGVKLVNGSTFEGLLSGGTTLSDGYGYMTQASLGSGYGIAEDIKFFEYKKGSAATNYKHEFAAVANGVDGVVLLDLNVSHTTGADATGDMGIIGINDSAINTDGYANALALDNYNKRLYVADKANGLVVIDLDATDDGYFHPSNMSAAVMTFNNNNYLYKRTGYNLYDVVLDKDGTTDAPTKAYLAYGSAGVDVLNISDISNFDVSDDLLATYPGGGAAQGIAYGVDYDASNDALYVAMGDGNISILSLDASEVSTKNILTLMESVSLYGDALGIAHADVDVTDTDIGPHLFIANGSGGFVTAAIRPKPHIRSILPTIQPVQGGDTIKVIGSGFVKDEIRVTVTVGSYQTVIPTSDVSYLSNYEITFVAPSAPGGFPGDADVTVTRVASGWTSSETLSDCLEYAEAGKAIVAMAAPESGDGIAAPGGDVPIDLILRTNGSGTITSVTARIEYDTRYFSVARNADNSVSSSVFSINNIEKDVELTVVDTVANDNKETLVIVIYSENSSVNTLIPDQTNLGTVYLTIASTITTDTTLSLDNSDSLTEESQVSTGLGTYTEALGSTVNPYVKRPPTITLESTSPDDINLAGSTSTTFGPFRVTAAEYLDPNNKIEGAQITFTVSSNALVHATDSSFTASTAIVPVGASIYSSSSNSITVLSNSNGQAEVNVKVGTKAGTYTITITGEYNGTALDPDDGVSDTFIIQAEETQDSYDYVGLVPSATTAPSGSSVTITATAYDRYGNPVASTYNSGNTTISPTPTIYLSTDKGSISPTSGSTNSSGQLTATLTLENTIGDHVVTAYYTAGGTTLGSGHASSTVTVTAAGPDVNADGSWDAASDIQQAIVYHINWTDLSINATAETVGGITTPVSRPSGDTYVPGDTNQNNRMDLHEVIAIINLSLSGS
ncbi:MAG: IPT/TIG domain-containing protein [bacterium]